VALDFGDEPVLVPGAGLKPTVARNYLLHRLLTPTVGRGS
jgi:hypothetical protein